MSKEDSENDEPPELQDPFHRARRWADEISGHPLTDEQAIDLAGVFAALAAVEAQDRIAAALRAIEQPLEAFLALYALSGAASAPEPSESPEKAAQQPQEPVSGHDEGELTA